MKLQVPWKGVIFLVVSFSNTLRLAVMLVPFIAPSPSSDLESLSREFFGRFEV
jgi:hypothetical protein